jgi:hypothetical protein
MIFWNIKLLKQRLIDEGLSQNHLFAYIFIHIMFYEYSFATCSYDSIEDPNIYDHVASIANITTYFFGTILIYRVNSGSEGKQFAERFFSIGFVVGVRFSVLFIPIFIFPIAGFIEAEDSGLFSTWYELIYLVLLQGWLVALFWRMIVHVKEVANTTLSLTTA